MLSAAGALRWLRAILGADYDVLTAEAPRWPPGDRGPAVPALPGRRAHAARRPRRTRRVRRPEHAPRPRRARARGARGRRLRPARLARPGRRARRPPHARARLGRRRAQRLWLRIVASVLELPLERVAVDEGAAFGAALLGGVAAGVWPDVHAAVAATVRPGERIEPVPEWVEPYRERASAFARCTRRCADAADPARRTRRSSTSTGSSSTAAPVQAAINEALRRARRARTAQPSWRASSGPPTLARARGADRRARGRRRLTAVVDTYHEIFERVYLERTRWSPGSRRYSAASRSRSRWPRPRSGVGRTAAGALRAACVRGRERPGAGRGQGGDRRSRPAASSARREAVMVGDTVHDIDAAHANGMRAVAVTWGIGEIATSCGAPTSSSGAARAARRLCSGRAPGAGPRRLT